MEENQTIIRRASETDVSPIVSIWKEMMDFHAARDSYFELCEDAEAIFEKFVRYNLDSRRCCVLVAECGNTVVGYCQSAKERYPPVYRIRDFCEVIELAVTEKYRRKGVGEKLLQEALRWAEKENLKRIECKIGVANEVSTRFWRKMKFRSYLGSLYLDM